MWCTCHTILNCLVKIFVLIIQTLQLQGVDLWLEKQKQTNLTIKYSLIIIIILMSRRQHGYP